MTAALHLLRSFFGFVLATVALLATVIAAFVVIAMTLVWWQEGRLNQHDQMILRWGALAAAVGALFTWAGFRLARGRPKPGEARVPSFTLTRSPGGRQERFVGIISSVFYLVLFSGWLWGRVAGDPWARGVQVAGWLAVVYLGLHVRVLVHELGHLGAARLLGMELLTLRVGAGPTLWRGRTRAGMEWEWRLRPSSGYAEAFHPAEAGFRRRQLCFIAGGPLTDVAFLGMFWWFLPHPHFGLLPGLLVPSAGLTVANLVFVSWWVSAVMGLVPRRVRLEDLMAHSDGWWLWKMASSPTAQIREWVFGQAWARVVRLWNRQGNESGRAALAATLARYPEHAASLALLEGRMHRSRGDHAEAAVCFERVLKDGGGEIPAALRPHLWAERAAALAAAGQVEGARAECEALLAQAAPGDRLGLLDAFACLPILHPDAGVLLPNAEAWAQQAVALAPERITLRGTLGSLLIERGREAEGETILREVLARTDSNTDRGIAAFYLGLVAGRRGRRREMEAYRRQALHLCAVPVLRARMEAEPAFR